MRRNTRKGTGAALLAALAAVVAMATGAADAHAGEVDLYLLGESFTWKEFDTDGTRLLRENGPLYGIGYAYHGRIELGDDDSDFYEEGEAGGGALTITPRVELFGGKVDYDGQACDLAGTCTPLLTETAYAGGKIELDLGISGGSTFRLEPFVGAGVRGWVRTIQDKYESTGTLAKGYAERWISTYGRAGVRVEIRFFDSSKFFLEAAARKPINNSETIYLSDMSTFIDDVTVNPGEKSSVFYEAGFKFAAFKISAYYESLRYSESAHVLKYNPYLGDFLEHYQPRSEADIFGGRIGFAF